MATKLALAHIDLASLDAALAAFARALEIDPYHADAYWGRAQVRQAHAQWRDAARDLECALEFGGSGWPKRREVESELRSVRRVAAMYP